MDPVTNFAATTLTAGITNVATTFTVGTGTGALFPQPSTAGAFNVVLWNSTDYSDPVQDPSVEIVRVTARSTDTFTITRAQEGTAASAHNLAGKAYKCTLTITAKMITDIGGANSYTLDTGTTNTFVVAVTPPPAALVAGQVYKFKASNSNTGASTLNVAALGAKNLFSPTGGALVANDITANAVVTAAYDGTSFYLQSSVASIVGTQIQNSTYTYGVDTGTPTAYSVVLAPAITAYAAGQSFNFKAANANTGACTISINALATKAIKVMLNGVIADPPANTIAAGAIVGVVYDGTEFLLIEGLPVTGQRLVGVYNPSAAASLAITGLTAGTRYRVEWNLTWNTTIGTLQMRFNSDSGSNYKSGIIVFASSNTAGNTAGTVTSGYLYYTDLMLVGGQVFGNFTFQAQPGALTKAVGNGTVVGLSNNGLTENGNHFTSYAGAANVTEFDMLASAGTFTGQVLVYALGA